MSEAVGSDIRGGTRGPGGSVHDGALGDHLKLFFQLSGSGGAVDAATTGEHRVVAPAPVDGVGGRGSKEREEPVGMGAFGCRDLGGLGLEIGGW
jgi:hypothetical protein